ncbi:MAG: DegT/DnrJ/EryC1/StrS family aminotransferase [Candidatus Kariarchaeaceae archaeon]|jgi:perosamine synthetase
MEIPFHRPYISKDEVEEVAGSLRSGWLTTGPKVKQFESDFARYIGCKHAIAVNSCTAALHLALDAIGIQRDDIVITTPMTFAATAEVIRYFGARPLFIDIDEGTMNISPVLVEKAISELNNDDKKRVKAIIPVHYAGQPCDMDSILNIADKYNFKVIEDAAHTLPAKYKDKMIGTIGDITCFSFYATKCITTGEGGMIATDNNEYAEKMRIMSLHGISNDAWKRYTSEGDWYYEILYPGYKYNMTDIAAALGIQQLKKADLFHEIRTRHANSYTEAFSSVPEIELPEVSSDVVHSWHLYVIKLKLEMLKIDRAAFIYELKNRGVHASVHFIPLHLHPYYRDEFGYKPSDFPVASRLYDRIVSLPFYPKMSDGELEYVINSVKEIISKNRVN